MAPNDSGPQSLLKFTSSYVLLNCRSKQPVSNMPNYHFIQHRLEKTNVSGEGNYIEQHETAIAQNSSIRKPIGSLYYWSS